MCVSFVTISQNLQVGQEMERAMSIARFRYYTSVWD